MPSGATISGAATAASARGAGARLPAVSEALPAGPGVAVISAQQTPYRLHFLRRVVRELPQVTLWSVFTHEGGANTWKELPDAPEIRPVHFGLGEDSTDQDKVSAIPREWRRSGRIIRWMAEHRIRAVVLYGYKDVGRLRIIRWCRRNGVACYLFADANARCDAHATGPLAPLRRAVRRAIVGQCAGVMPCGTCGREYFLRYGVRPERVFYSPYEPDYDLIRSIPAERVEAAKARFGLSDGRRRLIYTGRLAPEKRVDLLVGAFAAVADERPDWDLVIVGRGPLGQELEARVPPRLRPRVTWTGFVDDQAVVSALYRACDVLVLPSSYEPWALVVNEAVAAGLAVVSSDIVGAAVDLVRDGVNGRLFTSGDGEALRRALLDVTHPLRIDAYRANAAGVLAEWRRVADPVDGLRRALAACGVLPAPVAGAAIEPGGGVNHRQPTGR